MSAKQTSAKKRLKVSSVSLEVITEDVPLVQFMYLVFTRMTGETYRMRLRSLLLCLCDVFRALINSLVCRFCTSARLGRVMFQIVILTTSLSYVGQKLASYSFPEVYVVNKMQ